MDRDKAPGADRFSFAFFQDCWELLKVDVISFSGVPGVVFYVRSVVFYVRSLSPTSLTV